MAGRVQAPDRTMNRAATATRSTYAGLFTITLATLTYEILLTRIFSVTMWYHFSFVAISVAMFGMTAGAILVYLSPGFFRQERLRRHLAAGSLLFAVTVVASFLIHLAIRPTYELTLTGICSVIVFYIVIAVPFVFSGVCVSLVLTRFPKQVGRLYAADLAGAAAGCVMVVLALKITDGPTAVLFVALLAGLASLFFGMPLGRTRLRRAAAICCVVLAGLGVANTVLAARQTPLLRLWWVKGKFEFWPLYEKWNSFSRITVTGSKDVLREPFGWGLSAAWPPGRKVRYLWLTIDAGAGTILPAYKGDGNLEGLQHLKYDVVNVAHWIRSDAKTLVVGSGGGRDILSALVFGHKSVTAVEINEDILDAVNREFGDFTGHLDRDGRITFVNDEARSFIARQSDSFDIMQISLIDTWAATAAGAFVLTENSLYTVEAWRTFLQRLTGDGILTISRWYWAQKPGEVYRLVALAAASLKSVGVADPRSNMVVIRNMTPQGSDTGPDGVGTILLSRKPFSNRDLDTLEQLCKKMQFEMVLSPRSSLDRNFDALATGQHLDKVSDRLRLNVQAPTDDTPFFFHQLRLKDIFDREEPAEGVARINLKAVAVLGTLLITVVSLTVLCLIVPLVSRGPKGALKRSWSLLIFFACIGMGFMLVEISQMQRLIVFLGHPTYGLSVVLFSLLVSAGLGSYSTRWGQRSGPRLVRLAALLGLLCVFGAFTREIITSFEASVTAVRICVAVAILFPLGLFMGMAFPMGMKLASVRSPTLTPWLWGVNGATSVCASVLAVAIALSFGITTSFWSGFACYVAAFLAFLWASRAGKKLP